MKSLAALSLVCLAISSTPALARESSGVIEWPTHPNSGAYFDAESSVHGICRVMGFEYGVEGSVRYSSGYGKKDVIQVDREGVILLADQDFPVAKVICINPVHTRPSQTSAVVEWPKHPDSGAFLDAESSVHGICRVMGFEYGVEGSIRYSSAYGKKDVININASGMIVQAEQDYPVAKVLCVNRTGTRPAETSTAIEWPQHPQSGTYFDAESSVHGICRALGARHGIEGSIRYSSAYGRKDVVQVNLEGRISHAEQDYPVAKVLCVK